MIDYPKALGILFIVSFMTGLVPSYALIHLFRLITGNFLEVKNLVIGAGLLVMVVILPEIFTQEINPLKGTILALGMFLGFIAGGLIYRFKYKPKKE